MEYRIRPAEPADLPQIHAMILALAEFEQLSHLVVASVADLARELFGQGARVGALVAEAAATQPGDRPLMAFALHFHNYSTFLGRQGLYLEDLFVLPQYRRQGIARALLESLAAYAVQRGCGRFEWSVLEWNTNAIRFYEGLGATVLPDWRIVRLTGAALEKLAATPIDG